MRTLDILTRRVATAIAAMAVLAGLATQPAAAGGHRSDCCDSDCIGNCTGNCTGCSACGESCNPCDYRCKRTDELETIERDCAVIETEAVCIPPITTSPFDCFRRGGRSCGACGQRGCGGRCDQACETGYAPSCTECGSDSTCDGDCCVADDCTGQRCGRGCGFFGRLMGKKTCSRGCGSCGNGCGRIRCVKKLGSDSYEDGQQCVTEWEAVKKDGCGQCD